MRWIRNDDEYRSLRALARWPVDVDSGRRPTNNSKLYFCDVMAINDAFVSLVDDLLSLSGDGSCAYMVLDPDPEYFWHDRLGGYPVFEMGRQESANQYLEFLNQQIGSRPGGNMADMWYSYVIFPGSLQWCVHTIRSERDDTGHLWVPPDWTAKLSAHPFLSLEPSPESA